MSNYIKLINNLEILKLERIKQNLDKYIELINKKEKDIVESLYELTNLEIELMNENMVYGAPIFTNITNGTAVPYNYTIDKSQLSLFRLRHDLTVARNDAGDRYWYWLRDVVSSSNFAYVRYNGYAGGDGAGSSGGVRPAFLIY